MNILKYKKIFFLLSGILVVLSIFSTVYFGLNLGIDFTGGSVLEFSSEEKHENIQEVLNNLDLGTFSLRESDNSYILRTRTIDEATKNQIVESVGEGTAVERFNTIGPTLGKELKEKALMALLFVIVAIIFFVAYAFRHVSTPVTSWKYGFATIIALVHDIFITIGVFAFAGYFFGIEITSLFITALLVILGYSINDTIVVFDRVRDNLNQIDENKREKEFDNVLNTSFRQTFLRSFNTSLTTLISLFVLYFIGIDSIKDFVLALIVGIISGTYSSIFLAVPLLSIFKTESKRVTSKK